MELETINKLYLELSQITTATTAREILLQKQLAEAQAALKTVMRNAELSKEPCGSDPESPAAIRNGKFAGLASIAAQGLGMVRGPSLTEHLVEAQRDAEVNSDVYGSEKALYSALLAAASQPPAVAPVQVDQWLPIESAPKDGTPILLRSKKGRVADGLWVTVSGPKGYWAWAYVNVEPAHYMPLPAPPLAAAQKEPK